MAPENPSAAQRAEVFERHRPRLHGLAYRMLGSPADADDVVQDAWLRWDRAPTADIRTPEAWLVTTATRIAIDRLRRLRSERDTYVGPWLPEPLLLEPAPPADRAAELASDLSVAFLAVLERLAPEERAAFLLHELFDSGYGDIAAILGKSESACRQIVSRARKRVLQDKPRVQVSSAARTRLLDGLLRALHSHDEKELVRLLCADATWTSDGGGKMKAAKKVVRGSARVARFGSAIYGRYLSQLEFRHATINGEAGFALFREGKLFAILSIDTDGQRILGVYTILNPEKLRGLALEGVTTR